MSKKKNEFNPEDLLNEFIEKNEKYFGAGDNGKKYLVSTTRYEAWLLGTFLSNMVLIDKMKKLIKKLEKK